MKYNKVTDQIIKRLKNVIGEEWVITDSGMLEAFKKDETSGVEGKVDVVVKPCSAKEISEIMRIANDACIPVTPRGAGTGVSGGAIPLFGGIVLSTERMNKIIEIDKANRVAIVEPAVITGEFHKEVEKEGLFYPPDPASLDSCTLGGNVAEGAGGPRAVKYGVTRNYILGIEFVSAQGDIILVGGKFHKDATGYNLIGLLVGSEGTLGIFTKLIIKLIPLPNYRVDLLISFSNFKKLISVIKKIFPSYLPTSLEFIEKRGIELAKEFLEGRMIAKDAEAYLIMGFDGDDFKALERQYEAAGEICLNEGAIDVFVADNSSTRERLWKARRSLHDAIKLKSSIMEREDVVVPVSELEKLIEKAYIWRDTYKLDMILFGHAGDGNIHINILKGDTPIEKWRELKEKIVEEILREVVSLKGTLTGEHGIGIVKKKYLHLAVSKETIELYKRIKKAFDPNEILNPGKIIP